MNIEYLDNNRVKLTAPNGVLDLRDKRIYSEVICKTKDIKYFKAVE